MDNLIWFIVLGIFTTFALANPKILTFSNLMSIIYAVSMVGFLVFAQSIVLLSGNFDLSVSAIAAFSATVVGMVAINWIPGTPWPLLILLMIAIGAIICFYNGVFISKIKVNPFLQTLGTYLVLYGFMLVIAGRTLYGFSSEILFAGGGKIGGTSGIPVAVIILILTAIVLHYFFNRTPLGRRIYAAGSNPEAAKVCGINVEKTLIIVFVMSGILSAVGGLLYMGYMGCVTMDMAMPDLFPSFAGAIIDGISLKGGRGKMSGVLGGIILLGTLEVGLILFNISANLREAISGIVLVAAILINTFQFRLKAHLLAE